MNYLTTEDGKPIKSTNPLPVSSVITDEDGNNVKISDSGEMKTVTTVTDADGNKLAIDDGQALVKAADLEALIGEVADEPEENTLLARLKSLEDKIDAITAGTTPVVSQLSGSNVAEATTLNVTLAGTRQQLPDIACSQVMIIAKRDNTGYIYVGKNTVSSTVYGAELGELDCVVLPVSNANEIYIDASVSGEGISYVAI